MNETLSAPPVTPELPPAPNQVPPAEQANSLQNEGDPLAGQGPQSQPIEGEVLDASDPRGPRSIFDESPSAGSYSAYDTRRSPYGPQSTAEATGPHADFINTVRENIKFANGVADALMGDSVRRQPVPPYVPKYMTPGPQSPIGEPVASKRPAEYRFAAVPQSAPSPEATPDTQHTAGQSTTSGEQNQEDDQQAPANEVDAVDRQSRDMPLNKNREQAVQDRNAAEVDQMPATEKTLTDRVKNIFTKIKESPMYAYSQLASRLDASPGAYEDRREKRAKVMQYAAAAMMVAKTVAAARGLGGNFNASSALDTLLDSVSIEETGAAHLDTAVEHQPITESLSQPGDTISHHALNRLHEMGNLNPTQADITAETQRYLDANNMTWEDAEHLSVGQEFLTPDTPTPTPVIAPEQLQTAAATDAPPVVQFDAESMNSAAERPAMMVGSVAVDAMVNYQATERAAAPLVEDENEGDNKKKKPRF